MWFKTLTGFSEESPEQVRSNLLLEDQKITSKVNGKSWICGTLEVGSLAELQQRSLLSKEKASLQVSEVIGNVQNFHLDPHNAGAFFQAASQFNLLEMVGPDVSPEEGIGIYEYDRTQGPACAIVCGAGTIYRNYFAEVNGKTGQTVDNQINGIHDLGLALGNEGERLWKMQNGYTEFESGDALAEISSKIAELDEEGRNKLKGKLRIGLQWDTQVVPNDCTHTVTQAYCSALPVGYSVYDDYLFTDFAKLVLEASYEATLHAALINYKQTGNNKVFLTFLGGGAFGNEEDWIFDSIKYALQLFSKAPLDIYFVSYSGSHPRMHELIEAV